MMIKYLFVVWDIKVGVFQKLFFMCNVVEVICGFEFVVNDYNIEFYCYLDDFIFYQMVEFDEEIGVIM